MSGRLGLEIVRYCGSFQSDDPTFHRALARKAAAGLGRNEEPLLGLYYRLVCLLWADSSHPLPLKVRVTIAAHGQRRLCADSALCKVIKLKSLGKS